MRVFSRPGIATGGLAFFLALLPPSALSAQPGQVQASDRFGFALQLYRDEMYLPAAEEFLSIAAGSAIQGEAEEARLWAARSYYGAGEWGLPMGFIEADEDFLTAAIREVKEETGLDVEIRSILSVVSNFLSPRLHTLAIVLLARVGGGELCAADDLEDVAWFPLAGPLPEMAFEADAHICERYYQTRLEGAPVDPGYAVAE